MKRFYIPFFVVAIILACSSKSEEKTPEISSTPIKKQDPIEKVNTPEKISSPPQVSQELTLCSDEKVQTLLMDQTAPLIGMLYDRNNLADCSGMFHRLAAKIKEICPYATLPSLTYRDTRAIAEFYHQNKQLLLIDNAISSKDLIQPGAVLFYGYPGKSYSNFSAEDLFLQGSGINHVGVVIEVEHDENGLINYTLFHGRRPGRPAAITSYHRINGNPPFGNGTEQLVAISPFLAVK